ncbi:O-antigen ligase family protein [Candidatus Neomarinimicrobiota bacterium]
MESAFKINIWRMGIWLLFPIMGIQTYLHGQGAKLLGYSILFLPYCTLIVVGFPILVRRLSRLTISRKYITTSLSFLAFIFLMVIASFRSISSDFQSGQSFSARMLFIIVIVLLFAIYSHTQEENGKSQLGKRIWMDICISIVVFLVLNLFAYAFLGLESVEGERYIVRGASRISFLETKIEFPLVKNTREFSQIAGLVAIIVFGATLSKTRKGRIGVREFFNAMLIALSMLVIILADARMTLFVTLFGLLMMYLFVRYRRFVSIAWGLSFFFLLFPLFYFLLLFSVNMRSGLNIFDSNLWTLTGRLYIWASVLPEILRLDMSQILFGAGAYSQDLTGMNENYAVLFTYLNDTRSVTYHNAMIQIFFDIGFVGSAVYVMLVLSILKAYQGRLIKLQASDPDRMYLVTGVVVLLYYLGLGTTEAITPIYYDSYLIVLVILITSISIWQRKQPPTRRRKLELAAS